MAAVFHGGKSAVELNPGASERVPPQVSGPFRHLRRRFPHLDGLGKTLLQEHVAVMVATIRPKELKE